MPIEQEQQTTSANSPANIIILIGENNESDPKQLENRIDQATEAAQKKAKEQGREINFGEIHILGDGTKTIQKVAEEKKAFLQNAKFTGDNTALFLLAHGNYNGEENEGRFGGSIDNRQSLQGFLKAYPHLTKFPIKTGFCHDGSMFKTATQKELTELDDLKFLEGVSVENLEQKEGEELLQEYKTQTKKLTDKIKTNTDNSIIKDTTISTSTSSKFPELTSNIIENIGQYIENIYSNPKSPLQQLIAEDLASPSSRYILHNNKITKLSKFLKGLNVESDEVKNNDLKGLAEKFINHRKEQLKQAYPDQKDFIETLGKEEELNSLVDKILNKDLILFSFRGTPSAVEILLSKEEEIDINRQNQDGWTALHLACSEGHQEIVKMLLEKGADINSKNQDGQTALHIACQKGHQEIVKMLLGNKNINPDIPDHYGWTALHLACNKGHQEVVEMLLENENIDPNILNKDGKTALHIACNKGHQEVVEMLLANKNIDPNIKNAYGWTALHIACEEGFQDIVEKLLTNEKIDPNILDKNGQTALHNTCEDGDEIIVEILLGRVNPAIQDKEGYTALHLACKNGHKEVVGMLLEKGVDINSTNKEGQTALDVAIENYRQGIADYLVSQGALTGEELSQKRSSKSSEAKDGLEPSSSPTHPEKKPVSLEPEDSTRGHQ